VGRLERARPVSYALHVYEAERAPVLDTVAATQAFSANTDVLSGLEHHDRSRREAAVERLRHSVPEFERTADEVVAATEALIAGIKGKASELNPEELKGRLTAVQGSEQTFATLLDVKRDLHKRALSFLSEKDRTLFARVKPLLIRDDEASTRICEAQRDARWTLMAMLADRTPSEETVEISSAADIRRALIGH
jgi:hypothetical protein